MKPYVVYVLRSRKYEKTYVGQTNSVDKRLLRHNKGLVQSTKSYCPWEILHTEGFETRAEAMKREQWFKSGVGRNYIKHLIKNIGNEEV